jgi:hypothetical protein
MQSREEERKFRKRFGLLLYGITISEGINIDERGCSVTSGSVQLLNKQSRKV